MPDLINSEKIVWLASFPKSGNTWFRAFLTALMNNGKVEINALKTDGIFSDRTLFDLYAEIESRDLTDREVKMMIADVYRFYATQLNKLNFIKVHDAFETDEAGLSIIPEDVTRCAIYIIRNPLDIVGSLANHSACSIQDAFEMLNNHNYSLAKQQGNLNRNAQFRQYVSDWSSHVKGWTLKPSFPVIVIRYEDMLTNPFETFTKAVTFIGLEATPDQISAAIRASSFEQLSSQEIEKGFQEKTRKSKQFFRSGKMGVWKEELNQEQISALREKHEEIMRLYNYL